MAHFNQSTESKSVPLKDGRSLVYAEYGDPDGTPIIGFHGMPGSRLMMRAVEKAALESGARIIAPERPGYGVSQPSSNPVLLHHPTDVLQLADSLGLTHFAVMGVSGGGPYALACSVKAPKRVKAAVLVSGIGPLTLPESTRDMLRMNRLMFNLGRRSPQLVGFLLPRLTNASLRSANKHVQQGTSPTPDLSPQLFAIMMADQQEAVVGGGKGIASDMKILWQPWGFQLEDIQTKVYLFHGEADNLAPVRLAHYLADHLPNCEAVFYPEEGHTDPLTRHIDEIIEKVVQATSTSKE